MSEPLTRLEQSEGVALLTLDRSAKRNALSRALREELVARLDALAKDEHVSAVILTGAGPVFCAGFDRSELAGGEMAEIFSDATAYHHAVYTFAKPLLAAVNGAALGGGCDLAAMCDLRIATPTAVFGQPQVRFGAAAAYELMREVLPIGAAREMCHTGRTYSSDEALSLGLVNSIHEPELLLDRARELAASIATLPDGVPAEAKRQFVAQQPRLFES